MSDRSSIEWTEATWNPVTGCTPVSPGCDHCYAARMAKRLEAMCQFKYRLGFQVTCHPVSLWEPSHWRKPRLVFVCSMGDLFHRDVPDSFIREVFEVMRRNSRHTFQVLTKRPERMARFVREWAYHGWHPNTWLGVSVEACQVKHRISRLVGTIWPRRFVSFEPLLEDVGHVPHVDALDWIIVGCESGPGRRPMELDWARSIRDQCVEAGVPFFLKQAEIDGKLVKMPELDGKVWDEMPTGMLTQARSL